MYYITLNGQHYFILNLFLTDIKTVQEMFVKVNKTLTSLYSYLTFSP